MNEPRTEAGRRLAEHLRRGHGAFLDSREDTVPYSHDGAVKQGWIDAILAIEAEAVRVAATPDNAGRSPIDVRAAYVRGFAPTGVDDPLRDFMATYFDHDDDNTREHVIDFLDRIVRHARLSESTGSEEGR